MSDLIGIVFVRGKRPDNATIELATIKKYLLTTRLPMFESCGDCIREELEGVAK